MSRHDGVSCDSCMKNNFRGHRYKCLICYDYDLCASCYDEGATTTRHSTEHPMQCILTRSDFDLYYGGETLTNEQPQSYTCPYCNKMGLTDVTLQEHVQADHTDISFEVVCPVCAAVPGGDPNLITDDFVGHLTLEHRTGSRDLISFLDEPSGIRHGGVRRIPHSSRGVGSTRARRSNMHFSSSGGLSSLSPSSRESVDPIAELLSQLSGVRRSAVAASSPSPAAITSNTTSSQLQQLHMQIQLERQQVTAARQQLERLPRRQAQLLAGSGAGAGASSATNPTLIQSSQSAHNSKSGALPTSSLLASTLHNPPSPWQSHSNSQQFLLSRFMNSSLSDGQVADMEQLRADRSLFAQSLTLATLSIVEPEPENMEVATPLNENDSSESMNNASTPAQDKILDPHPNSQQRDVHTTTAAANNTTTATNHPNKPPTKSGERKPKHAASAKTRDLKSRGDTLKVNQVADRR
ncbi:E3 ubiquitin-protein ligase KCMF1-like isoform X2 [Ctenocephalides felis]|uniref:E3 ubiquitin-protein ligase KCMF1-like isoform X2 n=1 Tax=Ctenocephalides felis TaxID=7515 RepID=UPI000E6E2A37|nr:E3 ubiquitin-protein ligase KCMF1-like isoform X2 [Ctenocephalides felis]